MVGEQIELVSARIHLHFNLKFPKAGPEIGTGKCFYISRPVHNYTWPGVGVMIDRHRDGTSGGAYQRVPRNSFQT